MKGLLGLNYSTREVMLKAGGNFVKCKLSCSLSVLLLAARILTERRIIQHYLGTEQDSSLARRVTSVAVFQLSRSA